MGDSSSLLWGVLFGSIGMGYLVYGKRQQRGMALLSGAVLMAFPYFVSNPVVIVLVGALFMALPFFLRF